MKVGDQEVMFPFLVVPGLSSNIIAGIDWQAQYKIVIHFESEHIKFGGNFLLGNKTFFHMSGRVGEIKLCNRIRLKPDFWYEGFEENELGEEETHFEKTHRVGGIYRNDLELNTRIGDTSDPFLDVQNRIDKIRQIRNDDFVDLSSFEEKADKYVKDMIRGF